RDDPFERAVDALGQRSRVGLTVACALWVQHLGKPQVVGHRELVVVERATNGDRRAGEQRKLRHPARNEAAPPKEGNRRPFALCHWTVSDDGHWLVVLQRTQ